MPATRVDPDAVRLEEARVFLELDDAALSVQQEYRPHGRGRHAGRRAAGAPLLTLPVPEGAQEVRFDRDAFALGLAPDEPSGAVLRGPLPPGETQAPDRVSPARHGSERRDRARSALRPRAAAAEHLRRRHRARTESDRLHRRRPVKTTDRTYIALEAFQVEPSETVKLSLAPLGAPAGLPRVALYARRRAGGRPDRDVSSPRRCDRAPLDGADEATETRGRSRARARRRLRRAARSRARPRDRASSPTTTTRRCAASCARAPRRCCEAQRRRASGAQPRPARRSPRRSGELLHRAAARPRAPSDRFCAQCGARIEAREARMTSDGDGAGAATPSCRPPGLAKRFGPVTALAGVDLDVAAGAVVAVLGPNGAGKTDAAAASSRGSRGRARARCAYAGGADRRRARARRRLHRPRDVPVSAAHGAREPASSPRGSTASRTPDARIATLLAELGLDARRGSRRAGVLARARPAPRDRARARPRPAAAAARRAVHRPRSGRRPSGSPRASPRCATRGRALVLVTHDLARAARARRSRARAGRAAASRIARRRGARSARRRSSAPCSRARSTRERA